jgi:hypothetical protein
MLAYNEEFKENDDDDGRKLGHFRLQIQFLEITVRISAGLDSRLPSEICT